MQNIITHLKAITANKNTKGRPALQFVKITPQFMFATDSHKAMRIAHQIPISENGIFDIETLTTSPAEDIDSMQYPEIDSFFKEPTDKNSVVLDFKISKLQLKLLMAMKQEAQIILSPQDDKIVVMDSNRSVTIMIFKINKPLTTKNDIFIETDFFIDTIKALVDTNQEVFQLLDMPNSITPLQFSGRGFDYIVTPGRGA